ncbi:MAG: filamentous hemagglutinin N-terminal domain-containing protein [Deltaproteobacteria bacterium]|nr:MAG: filamentous hemagglutinin N-terminal domain-containing protein [Deltaproteobacteria bacterium]
MAPRPFWTALILTGLLALPAIPAGAEVVLDGSMGPAGAVAGPNYNITSALGTVSGSNLFHSFSNFNIGTGESATFSGPASIANIISRVTGGGASSIDGLLRSDIAGANLYLINPNGILFGQNARLDVSGSFFAATADYLRLGSGGLFDAANPAADLLTSDPPSAFGFLGTAPAAITVQNARLEVLPGNALTLAGGSLTVFGDGTAAALAAPGGAVNLLAGGSGEVGLGATPANALASAGDITVSGDWTGSAAQIDTGNPAGTGGRIYISGGRLFIDNAALASTSAGALPGGDLVLEGRGAVSLTTGQLLTATAAAGNAGSIVIDGSSVHLGGGSVVASRTEDGAAGSAGDITIRATGDVVIDDAARIYNDTYGDGHAGSILIDAGAVHIGGLSTVSSNSANDTTDFTAAGNAGDITIRATGDVLIDDLGWVQSEAFDAGSAGDITIEAANVSLLGGGYVSSYTNYTGDAGNIRIDAAAITVGESAYINSSALADTWGSVSGNAGSITLVGRDRVTITGASYVRSDTEGPGRGGDITLDSNGPVTINGAAFLSSVTLDAGAAGRILIDAGSLHVGDLSTISSNSANNTTDFTATGNAGDMLIRTSGDILIDGFASIRSEAFDAGSAGNITIEGANVSLLGSGYVSSYTNYTGDAGSILIDAATITLGESAYINSSALADTWGDVYGNAGSITLDGRDRVTIGGDSYVRSDTEGPGRGGSITLASAGPVTIAGWADITAVTLDTGAAGSVLIDAGSVHIGEFSTVSTNSANDTSDYTADGDAGDITIRATGNVLIDGFAWVRSEAFDIGDAGSIAISAGTFSLLGASYVSTYTNYVGNAGSILVDAGSIHIGESAYINSSALADTWGDVYGNAGSITLNADAQVTVSGNGAVICETQGAGAAGTVRIGAGGLSLLGNAVVSTNTSDAGSGGSIVASIDGLTDISGGEIRSGTSGAGDGGAITISSDDMTIRNGGRISATSTGAAAGTAGSISLFVAGDLLLSSGGTIATSTEDANGGDILVTADNLLRMRDSSITTSVRGGLGNGGNITLTGGAMVLDNASITANAYGGSGGNILITADPLLSDDDVIITASSQLGVEGTIGINAPLVDLGGSLAELPEGMLDDDLAPRNCSTVDNTASSFVVRDVVPTKRRQDEALSF